MSKSATCSANQSEWKPHRSPTVAVVATRSRSRAASPETVAAYLAAEAQTAGCPVAGYRRGTLPEVVEEGVSGILVDADDIEGLAMAIRTCLELDRRLVRSSARRRLGLEAAIDRYEAALKEVAH